METVTDHAALIARPLELRPGEQVTGTVKRLTERGAYRGNSLLVELDGGELVAIEATAKRGFGVLGRELERAAVRAGGRVRIDFLDWRTSRAGFEYRAFRVERGGSS
jgi:hypothetical protein